jgi:hypothetical protein
MKFLVLCERRGHHSFTQQETIAYLAERGIMAEEQINTIWHLSHGLPLYLDQVEEATRSAQSGSDRDRSDRHRWAWRKFLCFLPLFCREETVSLVQVNGEDFRLVFLR